MVGNHDTQPIWRLARRWEQTGRESASPNTWHGDCSPMAISTLWYGELTGDRCKLVQAKFADLFIGPARHVMIFFADLLGLEEIYNAPGTINDNNWTLRVPPDYARSYADACSKGTALNLPRVLSMALKQRGEEFSRAHAELISRLEQSGA